LSRAFEGYFVRLVDTSYLAASRAQWFIDPDTEYILMGFANEGQDIIQSIAAQPTAIWEPAKDVTEIPDWYDHKEFERRAQLMGSHAVVVVLVGERSSTQQSSYTRIECGRDWKSWNFAKVQVSFTFIMREEQPANNSFVLNLPPESEPVASIPGMSELNFPPLYDLP